MPTHDPEVLLGLLQYGDSAFPSGGFAFSWGIEGLAADGRLVMPDDLEPLVREQLRRRWATLDRPALRLAFSRAADDLAAVAAADQELEAATLAAPARDGSRAAGRGLLGVHARLGTPFAHEYAALAASDDAPGHLAIVQGVAGRGAGLPLAAAEAMSGWAVIAGAFSAAVRLGLVGHLAAQAAMARLRPVLTSVLTSAPAEGPPHAFTPLAEIAMARHKRRASRLFAT